MKKLAFTAMILVIIASLLTFSACGKKAVGSIEGYSEIYRCYIGQEGTFNGSDIYTFTSSDPSVLKVENGRYYALSQGSCSVTVRQKDGNSVAVLLFAVFGGRPIEIEALSLFGLPEGNCMKVADTVALQYGKTPEQSNNYKAIVWSSSDEDVLKVDRAGYLSALKPGVATITVSALGTDIKAQATVTVLPRDTVFKLNYSALTGVVGSEENILVADVLTDYPFDGNIEWFSENEDVVKIDGGTIEFLSKGTVNVGIRGVIDGKELSYICKINSVEDLGQTVIRTPEQLQDIGNISGNYMLGNDIDMQAACGKDGALYNGGKGFVPLFDSAENAFCGVFDGQGFSIKNLYINRINEAFVALFRYISAKKGNEGKIINLTLDGGEIRGGNYTAAFYANASGEGSENSGLENCKASLKMYSVGSLSALVGNNKGIVKNCLVASSIDSLGKSYLFALNHTAGDGYGVESCVYVGEAQSEFANLANGGYCTNCRSLSVEEASTFDFSSLLGNGWSYTEGELPTVGGNA